MTSYNYADNLTTEKLKPYIDSPLLYIQNQENCHAQCSKYLGKTVRISIDRPLGSKHPKYGFSYSVNYGFVPGTISGDGEELDAYVLGVNTPLSEFEGKCIAVIHRTNDNDDKLIIAPRGLCFSDDEIEEQTAFQEKWFQHIIIRQ